MTHLVMFDIDGTLVESVGFDADCYAQAVQAEINVEFDGNWGKFEHVTDSGILQEMLKLNNIQTDFATVENAVKQRFIDLVKNYLMANPLPEIKGANAFLQELKKHDDVQLAMATGGWGETALMKLDKAGIQYHDIPIATSNDHYARIEIMKIAAKKTGSEEYRKRIYFGDGAWDKKACSELAYDFVAIGNDVEHPVRYQNFSEIDIAGILQSL